MIPRYGDAISRVGCRQRADRNRPSHGMGCVATCSWRRSARTISGARWWRRARSRRAPRLMLNEYSLEYDSREERDRRYLFLKLVEGLRRSGAPLDGIGLAGPPRPAQGHGRDVIDRRVPEGAGRHGVWTVVVTELDVKEAGVHGPGQRSATEWRRMKCRRYLDTVLGRAGRVGGA